MVLWLDFVICLCYVCSLDRLLSCMGARRGAAKVAHTAPPHSTSFFGLILTGLTILPLIHFAEVVTPCQRRRLHHGGPQPTLPESPSQPAPTQLVITVELFWWTYYKKEKKKQKKTKNEKWKKKVVLWLDFVICLCYVGSLDRLLSCMGARRGAAKVAHTAPPHSTSFFGLILTGLTILPLIHFAEVVTPCQRRRLHHGGPQPTLPESPSQPAPTQLVITVDVIFVILMDLLQKG